MHRPGEDGEPLLAAPCREGGCRYANANFEATNSNSNR